MDTGTGPTRRTIPVRLVVAGLLLALLLILVLQNSQTVTVSVLIWDIEGRLIWTLLAVALAGFAAGLLFPRLRR